MEHIPDQLGRTTLQVVTDAADACARALVRYCHAPKVLPRLCSTVTGDRNGKLRQCASSYLLQVTGWAKAPASAVVLQEASPSLPCTFYNQLTAATRLCRRWRSGILVCWTSTPRR